ncbi:MAG: hypothetical protein V1646_04180 [bacterium]
MNKIYNFVISTICVVTIISTSALFAGQEQRKGFVSALGNLFCSNAYQQQESVIDFLAQLHAADDKAFHQLFDYVVNKKGNLDFKLAQVLTGKNLIDKTGAPSESLKKTFNFLKDIIDDYNQETKGSCCGGCFMFWCRENGVKILDFTFTNATALVSAITTKKTIRSPYLAPMDRSREVEIAPLNIEFALKQLSGEIID